MTLSAESFPDFDMEDVECDEYYLDIYNDLRDKYRYTLDDQTEKEIGQRKGRNSGTLQERSFENRQSSTITRWVTMIERRRVVLRSFSNG